MGPKIPKDRPENPGRDEFCKNKFQEMLRDPSLNVINPDSAPGSVPDTPSIVLRCMAIVFSVDTYAMTPTIMIKMAANKLKNPTVHRVHILDTLQHVYLRASSRSTKDSSFSVGVSVMIVVGSSLRRTVRDADIFSIYFFKGRSSNESPLNALSLSSVGKRVRTLDKDRDPAFLHIVRVPTQ